MNNVKTPQTPYEKVKEFHKKFGMYIANEPGKCNFDEFELGLTLICEEYEELLNAIEYKCLVEILDAIGDLIFVLYGMLVRLGIDGDKLFDIIWKANMKKDGGKYREDGKLLKPEGWIPPQKEIEKLLGREQ